MMASVAEIRVRVPAKINLHLAVGELRPDGYHELVTVFCAVGLYDELVLHPANELSVAVDGYPELPGGDSNLAGRAAAVLAERAGIPPNVRMGIRKSIPVAGGMAGGSADAAAALVGCSAMWRLDITRKDLADIAATVGSDVPFLLHGGVAVATGRGETLLPVLTRHSFHWVLALSSSGLSTPAVYAELDRLRAQSDVPSAGSADEVVAAVAAGDSRQLARSLGNDLQAAAISLQPALRRVLYAGSQEGALACLVSGSGPTVAMLCRDADHAAGLAANLAGHGVCRAVRVASGPVPGARIVDANE